MKSARIIGSLMVLGMIFSLANKIPAQTICDSIVPIDSIYYYTHQLPYTIIDTNNLPKKTGHEIVVPFGDSVLHLKDKGEIQNGIGYYYCEYLMLGMDSKKNWVLIEEGCPSWVGSILINTSKGIIDSLAGYPEIFGNLMLNQSYPYTDSPNCVEIRIIQDDNIIFKRRVCFHSCYIHFTDFALSDNNELMFTEWFYANEDIRGYHYYKLKL